MKTRAVRLYGKKDLRLEEFELPEIKEDEILHFSSRFLGYFIDETVAMMFSIIPLMRFSNTEWFAILTGTTI